MKCVKKNLAIYQGILRRTTLALPPRIAQHGITRTSENALEFTHFLSGEMRRIPENKG